MLGAGRNFSAIPGLFINFNKCRPRGVTRRIYGEGAKHENSGQKREPRRDCSEWPQKRFLAAVKIFRAPGANFLTVRAVAIVPLPCIKKLARPESLSVYRRRDAPETIGGRRTRVNTAVARGWNYSVADAKQNGDFREASRKWGRLSDALRRTRKIYSCPSNNGCDLSFPAFQIAPRTRL